MNQPIRAAVTDERLDRLMRQAMQDRTDDVYARALSADVMARRIAGRPRIAAARTRPRRAALAGLILLGLLGLLLVALTAALVVGSRQAGETTPEMAVIDRVVEAINERDLETTTSSFTTDATVVLPQLSSAGTQEAPRSEQSLDTENFPEVWLGGIDAWGMEAVTGVCDPLVDSTIRCDVATRWQTLQVELGEEWTFVFDGDQVTRLEMTRVDLDPADRAMPLGYVDLWSWESWLRDAHPEQAAVLLYGDDLIWNFYFRYHPGRAAEIGASISEYLESRP